MDTSEITRRLVAAAYEQGWADACGDHLVQQSNPAYPIGRGKRDSKILLRSLDPNDLLDLR